MSPSISSNLNTNVLAHSLISSLKGQVKLPKDNVQNLRDLHSLLSDMLKETEEQSPTIMQSPSALQAAVKNSPQKRGMTKGATKNKRGEPKEFRLDFEVAKGEETEEERETVSLHGVLLKEIPKMHPGTESEKIIK